MFELGLSDIIIDTLSTTENKFLLNKTLWAIANILKDSEESFRKIAFENEGQILASCIELLFSVNDPITNLSALNVVNSFI